MKALGWMDVWHWLMDGWTARKRYILITRGSNENNNHLWMSEHRTVHTGWKHSDEWMDETDWWMNG